MGKLTFKEMIILSLTLIIMFLLNLIIAKHIVNFFMFEMNSQETIFLGMGMFILTFPLSPIITYKLGKFTK